MSEKDILPLARTWVDLEGKSRRDQRCVISPTCEA